LSGFRRDKDDDYYSRAAKRLIRNPAAEQFLMQQPFQPGKTSFQSKRCYLTWNLVGAITSVEMDKFNHGVEIQFTDSSKHKPVKILDRYNFQFAALGENGAIFASQIEKCYKEDGTTQKAGEEGTRPSAIYFKTFNGWTTSSDSDWNFHLPRDENVVTVGCTLTYAAAATDKQLVRIFSYSGVQRGLFSLNGPIVSMCGSTQGNLLAVVYYSAAQLTVLILDLEHQRRVFEGKVSLTPNSILTWLGFAEFGMLMTMDSQGVLRGLSRQYEGQWIPLLDTRICKENLNKTGPKDIYWPVGLMEDKLMCAICKNGAIQPTTFPKPVLSAVDMQIPFMDLNKESVQDEEKYLRKNLFLFEQHLFNGESAFDLKFSAKEQAGQDKILLQLFQRACKGDKSARALDLAASLVLEKSLQIAQQLALHMKKPALAQRIGILMKAKETREKAEKAISIKEFIEEQLEGRKHSKRRRIKLVTSEGEESEEEMTTSKGKSTEKPKSSYSSRWDEEDEATEATIKQLATGNDDEGEAEMSFAQNGEENGQNKENKKRKSAENSLKVEKRNTLPASKGNSLQNSKPAALSKPINPFAPSQLASQSNNPGPAAARPVVNPFAKKD
jgi:chromosome transmission fidelity protein 4